MESQACDFLPFVLLNVLYCVFSTCVILAAEIFQQKVKERCSAFNTTQLRLKDTNWINIYFKILSTMMLFLDVCSDHFPLIHEYMFEYIAYDICNLYCFYNAVLMDIR